MRDKVKTRYNHAESLPKTSQVGKPVPRNLIQIQSSQIMWYPGNNYRTASISESSNSLDVHAISYLACKPNTTVNHDNQLSSHAKRKRRPQNNLHVREHEILVLHTGSRGGVCPLEDYLEAFRGFFEREITTPLLATLSRKRPRRSCAEQRQIKQDATAGKAYSKVALSRM